MDILIVDDEAPARRKLVQFIQKLSLSVTVVEAGSAEEASPFLEKTDLVFLDIQMPGKNAFEFIEEKGVEYFPPIIFTTAHHHYALQAFEIHAIDYLLKPYTFDRFKVAFDRAMQSTDHVAATKRMLVDLMQKMPQQNYPTQIWVRHGEKLIPLQLADISHFVSDGNYVRVFCGNKKYLIRESLKKMEDKLNKKQFIRVHRSTIINRSHLIEMVPRSHGDLTGMLKGGEKIVISRRYREDLLGG